MEFLPLADLVLRGMVAGVLCSPHALTIVKMKMGWGFDDKIVIALVSGHDIFIAYVQDPREDLKVRRKGMPTIQLKLQYELSKDSTKLQVIKIYIFLRFSTTNKPKVFFSYSFRFRIIRGCYALFKEK